jgi:hypothetical protein
MSQHNRVVWAEGLFLRPQHFQQAERYLERLISQRLESLVPYGAGFTRLSLRRAGITEAAPEIFGNCRSMPQRADHRRAGLLGAVGVGL